MRDATPVHDQFGGRRERLWPMVLGPIAWAVHFLLCYITVAIWCARVAGPAGPLAASRAAVAAYTGAALVVVAWSAWRGYRAHRVDADARDHPDDRPEARHAFIGLTTLLLAGLSGVAIMYTAFAAVFIGDCR